MSSRPGAAEVCDFDIVRVTDVSRHYGRRRALSRVSIECRAGQIVGLFGPNGAGKSTLLGLLSTLVRAGRGRIAYGDRTEPEWGSALRGRIGVLGHDLFLYPDLTARENLDFFAKLYGVRDADIAVRASLAHARLEERADDRAAGFSRGLRQRLALERALIHRPRLVLLDEPFTGLDDESAQVLIERLRGLRRTGTIVVMATHDFDTADGLVDAAACLSNGRLFSIAPGAETLRERYRATLAGVSRA